MSSRRTRLHDVRRPRSTRPLTVDAPCITIKALRDASALVAGRRTYGEIFFPGSNGAVTLTVDWELVLPDAGAVGWIELRHRHPDRAPGPPYRFGLVLGTVDWLFVNPTTGKRHSRLYCLSGCDRFAPWYEHDMRRPSDSDSGRQRPLRRLQRLRARLAALLPSESPHSVRGAKVARLQGEIAEAELKVLLATAARLRRFK
jgi:hypothetical protein